MIREKKWLERDSLNLMKAIYQNVQKIFKEEIFNVFPWRSRKRQKRPYAHIPAIVQYLHIALAGRN